jgi:hypothetical protein
MKTYYRDSSMEEMLGNTGLVTEVSEKQIYGKSFIKNVLDRRKTPGKQPLEICRRRILIVFHGSTARRVPGPT